MQLKVPSAGRISPLAGSPDELLHILETEKEIATKQAALLGLAFQHPHSSQLLHALSKLLNHPILDVVALGIIGSQHYNELLPQVKQIVTAQTSRNPFAIAAAIRAWSELSTDEDRAELQQWLMKYLRHHHLGIRVAAARGLAKLGESLGFEVLEHLLISPVLEDRLLALTHLDGLTEKRVTDLIVKSLQFDFYLKETNERWRYRYFAIQTLATVHSISRTHWQALQAIAREWKQESDEGFQSLIRILRHQWDKLQQSKKRYDSEVPRKLQQRLRRVIHILENI
ncbi:MAG: hypothetical protein ABDI19_01980 [Armatimonadota bacterium]